MKAIATKTKLLSAHTRVTAILSSESDSPHHGDFGSISYVRGYFAESDPWSWHNRPDHTGWIGVACCVMVFLDEKWAWMVGKDKVSVDVRWNFYTGQWQVMQDSRNKAVVWKINKWKLVGLKKRTFQNSKKWAKYGSVGKTRKQINMHMNIHMSMQMKL